MRDGACGGDSDGVHVVWPHVHGHDGVATHLDGHLNLSGRQSRKRLSGADAGLWQPRPDLANAHVFRMPSESVGMRLGAAARDSVHAVDKAWWGWGWSRRGYGEARMRAPLSELLPLLTRKPVDD